MEMLPDLKVFQRHHTGDVIRNKPAIPDRNHYQFHMTWLIIFYWVNRLPLL